MMIGQLFDPANPRVSGELQGTIEKNLRLTEMAVVH